jgi:hypothetical protein
MSIDHGEHRSITSITIELFFVYLVARRLEADDDGTGMEFVVDVIMVVAFS